MPEHASNVTGLLLEWEQGDETALARLIPLVHRELHRIAQRFMAGEGTGHTLQPTALVNEAYVRLVEARANSRDRAHFFALAARIMRHILVDHARARRAQKRGADAVSVTLDEAVIPSDRGIDVVALNDALDALAEFDERKSRVVEMRFFGGLSVDETAVVLNVSPDTVRRDWRLGRAWLQREMRASPERASTPFRESKGAP